MNTIHLEELYNRHIKPLSLVARMRLVKLIMQDLAQPMKNSAEPPKRSIMELHGLGAEVWEGVAAQDYVKQLRDEWESRP
ncbi:MAG: hypothetical protein NT023_16040 [Armatimonadetes bacterium]|nr:hypothetical protein [Armatimonadota bacterium]